MRVIGDFHIHSRYAQACSKDIDLAKLEQYARLKGIGVLGTGDFQHPMWNKELKERLTQDDGGVLRSQGGFPFILQTEISTIFTQGGKGRRVHNLVLAPDLETADQVIDVLSERGRLDYDGRPIFGFSSLELVELMQETNKLIEVIPAHAWTPWFSVFGSKSGFDSLRECFQEQARHVHAIETGLSSDPAMNWRVNSLDGIQLLSFSDMHSFWPHRLGREATVFDLQELSYTAILNAIRTGEGLAETIEVDPAYGKYHWDGHRSCGVVMSPQQAIAIRNRCPHCGNTLTIGVEHRVEELADRSAGTRPAGAKPFRRLLPLPEIIAAVKGSPPFSRGVWEDYHKLTAAFGSEFAALLEASGEALNKVVGEPLAGAILAVRDGKVMMKPGYDGVYGEVSFQNVARREPRRPRKSAASKAGIPQRSIRDFGPRGQRTLGDF